MTIIVRESKRTAITYNDEPCKVWKTIKNNIAFIEEEIKNKFTHNWHNLTYTDDLNITS